MKKDMSLTVTLTPEDIRKAVARYVTEEFADFKAKPDDVAIGVGTRLMGYGQEAYLRDATVKITKTETKQLTDDFRDRPTQSFQDK